jgi:hypothetical protein
LPKAYPALAVYDKIQAKGFEFALRIEYDTL